MHLSVCSSRHSLKRISFFLYSVTCRFSVLQYCIVTVNENSTVAVVTMMLICVNVSVYVCVALDLIGQLASVVNVVDVFAVA